MLPTTPEMYENKSSVMGLYIESNISSALKQNTCLIYCKEAYILGLST